MPLEKNEHLFEHLAEVHHHPLRYGVMTAVSHPPLLTEYRKGLRSLFIKQRLSILQVRGVEPLGKPAVHRSEQITGPGVCPATTTDGRGW